MSLSGANSERARELAFEAAKSAPQGLISFGIAGGLDPSLAPGTLVVPSEVATANEHRYTVTPEWHKATMTAAQAHGLHVCSGLLWGTSDVISSVEQKIKLRRSSDAVAADMESHAVAEAAQAHRLPFLVIRAVADPAHRHIPHAAQAAIGTDGKTHLTPILRGVVQNPGLLGDLMRLSVETMRARTALRRAARELLPTALSFLGSL